MGLLRGPPPHAVGGPPPRMPPACPPHVDDCYLNGIRSFQMQVIKIILRNRNIQFLNTIIDFH